jgi:hypothetical protein
MSVFSKTTYYVVERSSVECAYVGRYLLSILTRPPSSKPSVAFIVYGPHNPKNVAQLSNLSKVINHSPPLQFVGTISHMAYIVGYSDSEEPSPGLRVGSGNRPSAAIVRVG